jgi:uncharacterized protein (DUF1697 family)
MPTIICLLRGVNVGGKGQLKMGALKLLLQSMKLRNVETYIQSGNVVFDSPAKNLAALAGEVENAIEQSFGFRPAVVLRTLNEMKAVAAANPFAQREGVEPAKLVVFFMSADPGAEKVAALKPVNEEIHHAGRELYIYFPDGQGKSKLTLTPIDKARIAVTARNWNTVMKLIEMGGGASS